MILVKDENTEMALMCSADEELKGKFGYAAFLPFTKKRLAALTRTKFRSVPNLQSDDLTLLKKRHGPDQGRKAAT